MSDNTNVTEKYKKNARYLEYNSNVVPENAGQLPLSITMENLNSLNYSAVDPITRNLNPNISLKTDEIETDIRIYHFQNESLPQRVQPATSPNVSINYIEFLNYSYFNQSVKQNTSNVFYVIQGSGVTKTEYGDFYWSEGDIFVIPYCKDDICHEALANKAESSSKTYLLWANDGPILRYLGAECNKKVFEPVVYTKTSVLNALQEKAFPKNDETIDQFKPKLNRNGVLLSNPSMISQKFNTLTPTLWSLYNTIGPNCVQKPHKHNSVALDYCVFSSDDTGLIYTLMGPELNSDGTIKNPQKLIWKKGGVFITPPGWWHSHVNESNCYAYVFPIQDAGLHTYMNTLDIQFIN
jgi:gentisate 1,2-dioxygenase